MMSQPPSACGGDTPGIRNSGRAFRIAYVSLILQLRRYPF